MTSYFSHKTIVVTGGAGFIGSHLCERLLSLDANVIAVDNFLTGQRKNIASFEKHPNFRFIEADVISDPTSYLPTQKIDDVLHFASPASPPHYQAHPIETYQVNSQATHLLLQYLHQNHPQARFLFASTSEVYGDPQIHPQVEGYWGNVNPNGIRSCYDEAKRLGETICGVHYRDVGMDVRIVRIFNTYGPRMDPMDRRVIPQFITEAIQQKSLSVFGDGSQTRSYCFVDDLVEGILMLLSSENGAGQTVNLGNPGEFTVLQTAHIISKLINPEIEPNIAFHPLPSDDPTRRRPDITRAQQLLNWQPKVSFEQGLLPTIEYFKGLV